MPETLDSGLEALVSGIATTLTWLDEYLRILWLGTVLDLRPLEIAFTIVIAWLLYRLVRMFVEVFLESWRAPADGVWDRVFGRLFSILAYGIVLLIVSAVALVFLTSLLFTEPFGWLTLEVFKTRGTDLISFDL